MNTIKPYEEAPTKTVVLYHADCADGFGAAYAAWLDLGPESDVVSYRPVKYGEVVDYSDLKGKVVYILDFSFPKNVMDLIIKECKVLIWLDHHKTAFQAWGVSDDAAYTYTSNNVRIVLDPDASGAMIAWRHFHGLAGLPRLIEHIDDYDRWQFKLVGTKAFNKALWAMAPWSFEQWYDTFGDGDTDIYDRFYELGEVLLKAHNNNVQAVLDAGKMECSMTWYEANQVPNPHEQYGHNLLESREVVAYGLAANCPANLTSDVGHKLATESGTYGLCWYQDNLGKIKCSLRSNGSYDVSAIAKKFGGGGHKNAAGFTLPNMSQLQKWFYPDRRVA